MIPPRNLNPRQRAAFLRGRLAELLRCMIERTEDRREMHRRLDLLLDRIERYERTGPDLDGPTIATIRL